MSPARNLIVILAHGLRSDALGDSGSWPLSTPNFARLTQHGLRLVASSSCPADKGGQISLLTGLHARQHGCVDPTLLSPRCDGWPGWLRAAGYHVAGVGCVGPIAHVLHQAITVADVDSPDQTPCAYLDVLGKRDLRDTIIKQRRQRVRAGPFEPDRPRLEPDADIDGFILAEARDVLMRLPENGNENTTPATPQTQDYQRPSPQPSPSEGRGSKPWALVVMLSGPGNDLPPPTLYSDLVDPKSLEDGFTPVDQTQADILAELDFPRVMLQRLTPAKIARIRADYLGRVALIDHGLGRLMAALRSRPDRDRTWFVVASDRGCLLGEHGLVGHRSFLCPALEVPFIAAPGTGNGGSPAASRREPVSGLFSTVDVAPTIAALAGCDVPRSVAGVSRLDYLSSEPPAVLAAQQVNLSEFGRRVMLETQRHKIIFDADTRQALGLYDLLSDPDEKENLSATLAGRNLLDSMRWRLGDALLPLRAAPR